LLSGETKIFVPAGSDLEGYVALNEGESK